MPQNKLWLTPESGRSRSRQRVRSGRSRKAHQPMSASDSLRRLATSAFGQCASIGCRLAAAGGEPHPVSAQQPESSQGSSAL